MPMPFPALQNLKVFGFVFAEKLMLLLGCNSSLLVEQESYGLLSILFRFQGFYVFSVSNMPEKSSPWIVDVIISCFHSKGG